MDSTDSAPRDTKRRFGKPTSHVAAALILLIYAAICSTTAAKKGNTFDEIFFLASGYHIWHFNDYHIVPEGGNLYQRACSLPLVLAGYEFPAPDDPFWQRANYFELSDRFFFQMGHDVQRMLWLGRMVTVLFGVAVGVVIYQWTSSLAGRGAGLVALTMFAFCPTILANSSLATADLFTGGLVLMLLGAFWRMLHRLNLSWLAVSCLLFGAVSATRHWAVACVPVMMALALLRITSRKPLKLMFRHRIMSVAPRGRRLALLTLVGLLHVASVFATQWTLYGFSYGDPDPRTPAGARYVLDWPDVTKTEGAVPSLVALFRKYQLLPEAALYGASYQYSTIHARPSFVNGEHSNTGFWYFFPFCFFTKSSLAWLAILALAGAAAWARARQTPSSSRARRMRRDLYRAAPLWIFIAVYLLFALTTNTNIGHRHLLPIYLPLCIFGGTAAWWFRGPSRLAKIGLGAALATLIVVSISIWPNYLAFFNVLAGGSSQGYRRLVDSSLDWGQDLPALRDWLAKDLQQHPARGPVYLAYFGTGRPEYYGIDARRLPEEFRDRGRLAQPPRERRPIELSLAGGTYCISATQLQGVYLPLPGPWNMQLEHEYRAAHQLMRAAGNSRVKDQFIARHGELAWERDLLHVDRLRFKRLCRYLLNREPDDNAGYSIFIYRLTDDEVNQALFGPLPD